MRMAITITQIAVMTGVSKSTVHRALSGNGQVSAALRERILACAAETSYRPNLSAQVLVGARTRLLALYGQDFGNIHFAQFLRGANQTARGADYHLLTVSSLAELRTLRQLGLEGFVSFFALPADAASLRHLGLPMVQLVKHDSDVQALQVSSGVRHGARLMMEHLLACGHRRIGHLTVSIPGDQDALEKRAAYESALRKRGLVCGSDLVAAVELYTEACGYAGAMSLLCQPNPPTAIFALADILAAGAYRAARELGVRVPHDISIAGYDDKDYSALLYPAMTTIRTPYQKLGAHTLERLIARIEKRPVQPSAPLLPELIQRASVTQVSSQPENRT